MANNYFVPAPDATNTTFPLVGIYNIDQMPQLIFPATGTYS
jgi:hypothetical protein